MTETVAFSSLMDLISFLGTFISSPIWFGLSFLNLLVIGYCIHFVIGILLGGIAPFSPLRTKTSSRDKIDNIHTKISNTGNRVPISTYTGGGKY